MITIISAAFVGGDKVDPVGTGSRRPYRDLIARPIKNNRGRWCEALYLDSNSFGNRFGNASVALLFASCVDL